MNALFHRLGGATAMEAVVRSMYRRMLADPAIAPLFDGVDIDRLAAHQQHFLALAFGGEDRYRGRTLTEAHAQLVRERGLGEREFDAVLSHLEGALREHDIEEKLVAETLAVVETRRREVLGGD